jgi:hypothetical protein
VLWALLRVADVAVQVEVQDTVGCGDSFAAAITMGYCRTHDVHATLLLANAVGAATAMGRGAGTNVARAETVMQLLQQAARDSQGPGGSGGAPRAGLEVAIDVLHSSLATMDEPAVPWLSSSGGNSIGNGNGSNGNGSSSSKKPAAHAA